MSAGSHPYAAAIEAPGLSILIAPAGPMVMLHLQHPAEQGVPAAELVGYLRPDKAGELVDALIGALTLAQEWRPPEVRPRNLSDRDLSGLDVADRLQREGVCPAADVVIPAFLRLKP